jgi:hypothetical protein
MSTPLPRRYLFRSSTTAVAVAIALIAFDSHTKVDVAAQAGGRALFGAAPPGRAVADAHRRGRPAPKRSRPAIIHAELLALDGAAAAPIALNLFDDVRLVAHVDRVERRSRRSFLWHGRLEGVRDGHATFASNDGVLAGTVFGSGTTFEISYAGDGIYDVRELDPSAFPTDDPIGDLVAPSRPSDTVAQLATDSAAQQDLLVVWTPAARVAAGGTPAIQSLIDVAVANANTAYVNSGVMTRLRLVYRGEVPYSETGISTDLNALSSTGDGRLDRVHALRDEFGADVVSLIGAGYTAADACGIGYLMNSPGSWFASSAFSVVDWSCAAGNLTLAHEIGHNQGLNHDPANAVGQGAYPYSYGYVDPGCAFRTVMAYGPCERVTQFSAPDVTFNGRVTGTPSQDNARTLNNTAAIVANFRQQAGNGCSYSLSEESVSVPAGSGSATIAVSTNPGCGWTASSNADWISVTEGNSGIGSAAVTLSIEANGGTSTRTGAVNIAGRVVVIIQSTAPVITSFRSDTAFPAAFNTLVTFTATATGGIAPLQYRFVTFNEKTGWAITQDYSPIATFSYYPAAGQNAVQVWVRSAGSTSEYETYTSSGYFSVQVPVLTVTRLAADRTFPLSTGQTVTFTALATGGIAPLEYRFVTYDAVAGWVIAQDYGASNAFTYKPRAGTNVVQVWVRSSGSTAPYDTYATSGFFMVTTAAPRIDRFDPSVAFPVAAGTRVTFTARASGGTGPLLYQFVTFHPGTGWVIAQPYGAENAFTYSPAAGQNVVQVWVRNADSTAPYDAWASSGYFAVTAASVPVIESFTTPVSFPAPSNTLVSFTASASGPSAVEYRFVTYHPTTGWVVAQDYGPLRTFGYFPAAGQNVVQVWVRSVGSTADYEAWATSGFFTVSP